MNLFSVCGYAIIACVLCRALRAYSSELSVSVAGIASVSLVLFAVGAVLPAIKLFNEGEYAIISGSKTVTKVLGISYFCSLACDICKQSGEPVLAKNLELAGKCTVCALCVPMIKELLEMIGELSL